MCSILVVSHQQQKFFSINFFPNYGIDSSMWPYISAIYLCGEHTNVVKGYFNIIIYGIWCHIRPCIGCPC